MIPVIMILMAVMALAPSGQNSENELLAGIRQLRVVVERLSPEAVAAGFSETQLRTDVELKLRLAGIAVVRSASGPYMEVGLNYLKTGSAGGQDSGYCFHIDIAVRQTALVLENNRSSYVTTWNRSILGAGRAGETQDRARRALSDLLDVFLNGYLSVNPKK